jgi:hypothetical protein
MTAIAHLASLYSGAPIIVWVEDTVTRDYLTSIWADPPDIRFLIAGGSGTIAPAVMAAERDGHHHVFGIVDRDFGRSNIARWSDLSASRVFRVPRHEIENYCLDVQAIYECVLHNRKRSQAEIQNELIRLAELQTFWLSCRYVHAKMKESLQRGFPSQPSVNDLKGVGDAQARILASSWYRRLLARARKWSRVQEIQLWLTAAANRYLARLGQGRWIDDCSGKEVFRQIREYIYQPGKTGSHDNDFAKAVGNWQFANGHVPADLVDLLAALRLRVSP